MADNKDSRELSQVFEDDLADLLGAETLSEAVLRYARRGWFVFPLQPDRKEPFEGSNGHLEASTDLEKVRAWWRKWPDANIGLNLIASDLVAIDPDLYKPDCEWAEFIADKVLPESYCQRSASGGYHYIFSAPPGASYPVKLCKQVDIKHKGYIVLAPSTFEGRLYEVERDVVPAPAPDWIPVDDQGNSPSPAVQKLPQGMPEAALRNLFFKKYPAEGLDYPDWLEAGFALHHETGGADFGFEIWNEWSRLSSKNNDKEQRDEWQRWQRGNKRPHKNPVTIRTIEDKAGWSWLLEGWEDDLEDLGEVPKLLGPSETDAIRRRVVELNRNHAVVQVGGKTRVLIEKPAGIELIAPTDLNTLFANDRVLPKGGKVTVPVSAAWLVSPVRRTYPAGLTFDPAGAPDGVYNLWRGWTVEPDAAAHCDLFLDHVRQVICAGDSDAADWLLKWCAHLVQRPQEKPGTAVILRGAKGAGKDVFGRYLGAMFKRNHVVVSQPEHLTGRFNSHLAEALLLHLEEGFWAGDHKAEGILKHLITSPVMQIERKGIDTFSIPNFLRLLVTSNAPWVVPATEGERRFLVLEVDGIRAKDDAYFRALHREMIEGGAGALLHYLQSIDLTGFDVRRPPITAALTGQKVAGLRGVPAWWLEKLTTGDLSGAEFEDVDSPWRGNHIRIGKDYLRDDFEGWLAGKRYHGEAPAAPLFARLLKEWCPGIESARPREGDNRRQVYVIPPLSDCRDQFESVIGGKMDWNA